MCLAIPGQILSTAGDDPLLRTGRVSFGGIVKEISLAYTPEANVGDYVIVHVGFALSTLDEKEAGRVFEYLREIGKLEELRTCFSPPPREIGIQHRLLYHAGEQLGKSRVLEVVRQSTIRRRTDPYLN